MKRTINLLILMLIPFLGIAQLSPSGRVQVYTPSVLSACASDTVWVELTNKNGPYCNSGSGPVQNVQLTVEHPTGGQVLYQAMSLGSLPAGATEVSYASDILTIDVPAPSFGATTKVWFVLNTTCDVVTLPELPSLDFTATYPSGFSTPTESWTSAKMNTAVGELTYTHGSQSYANATNGFGSSLASEGNNKPSYVYNTGLGRITSITYHQIIHDSLTPQYSGGDHMYMNRSLPTSVGSPVSRPAAQWPDYQTQDLGNGYRYYSFTIEGTDLDAENASLDPGERLFFYSTYVKAPTTCVPDMLQKQWVTTNCAGAGNSCSITDTLLKTIRISAGTPIISAQNGTVEAWDGCTDKAGSFTFKNTGVGSATDPAVGVAYDVTLGLSLEGKLVIDNLTLAGSTIVTTSPATPANVSTLAWNIKDLLTTDPDAAGSGLEDLDGDGYYDDLNPGDSIDVTFTYTLDCDASCGPDLYNNITATSSFTDYCGKLNGSSSTPLYEFGLKQTSPITQVSPLPNYGLMTGSQKITKEASYTFNYQEVNVNTTNAVAVLRINYSKDMQVHEPITFMGANIPLSSFIQVGTGSLDTTTYSQTTDVDSALEYTLSAAELALLFDNTQDALTYQVMHISCDSFQTQENSNSWQLLFTLNTNPCPAPNTAPPCALDLACNKSFGYNINEGCGVKPCYVVVDSIYRESPHGFASEDLTAGVTPSGAGATKFFEGDTLTFRRTAQLSGDYPVMENTGTLNASISDINNYFSFSYNKDPETSMFDLDEAAYQFIPGISRLKIYDTTTNTLICDVPIEADHFRSWNQFVGTTYRTNMLTGDNIVDYSAYTAASNSNSIPTVGLGDHYCFYNSSTLDPGSCPYEDMRYYSPNSNVYFVMQNEAHDRVSEYYNLHLERALVDANIPSFNPGYAKYQWVIETKWRVNPEYPHDNVSGLLERGTMLRLGNRASSPPAGTLMSGCGIAQATATPATKELEVKNAGKTYSAACGLTICNEIDYASPVGDFFPAEVRVPFMLDSFTVDLPAEYHLTAQPTFGGTAIGTANAIQAAGPTIGGGISGHILFTNNQANSGTAYTDFPRFNDADGGTTVWSVCYPVSNVGSDNFITESYKVPVTYYVRDEFGNSTVIIDTFNITESSPAITVTPLGGPVQVEDGGANGYSYMDVLVSNNTIYAGDNVFVAVESNANVTVADIEDAPGETPANPLTGNDKNIYNTSDFYAELGGMAAGGRRVLRITFSTTSCSDSIKIFSNFGCNYPTPQQPDYSSPTLDSAYISFNSVDPAMMSLPIESNIEIANLCDIKTVEIEVRNVKNPNLTNILAGFKLPPNAVYVANSAAIAHPISSYVAASGVTLTGTDSLTIDVSADADLATASGLSGADEIAAMVGWTQPVKVNAFRVKFDIDFTACPAANVDEVLYNVTGENYCGTVAQTSGIVNFIYTGTTNAANVFSCESVSGAPIPICSDSGQVNVIQDSIWVKNNDGITTNGTNKMEMTIANDTTSFTIGNFTVAAPWTAPVMTMTPEGRPVLTFDVPAGVAVGDSIMMILTYDMTPKFNDVCNQLTIECAAIAHSVAFYDEVTLACAAKSLTCSSLGQVSRGTGYVPRSLECCTQSLGNFVWLDADMDGVQDPGEAPVAGVTVTLYDSDGNIVGVTTTDAYGEYLFDNIPTGDYTVGFTLPPNYEFTSSTGTDDNDPLNSDVNPLSGMTSTVTITPGENETDVDAGIFPTQPPLLSSIGDQVWFDADMDGVQDANESPVAGVTVTLYDGAGNVVAVTTTDANGNYLFNDLPNGTYSVGFSPLPGTDFTTSSGTTPGNSTTDSDADPNTGLTGPIVISAPGTQYTGVDAGLIPDTGASIGDLVWNDLNQDGIQDPGEPGVPGVQMILWNLGPDGIAGTADDVAVDTVETDANGNYLFNGLAPDDYYVTATPPAGYTVTGTDVGSDNYADNDFSNVGGTQTSDVYNLLAGQHYPGVDMGIYNNDPNLGSIGDLVWLDTNGDGIQDPGEQGVPGVTVSLLDNNGNPVMNPATGEPYVVQTDINGNYLFTDLPAGDYTVAFSNLPPNYSFSPEGNGTGATGSDADPVTGVTSTITLGAGQDITDVDAGITPSTDNGQGSLGNLVWVDANNDGIQDPGEQGVPGVTVNLYYDADGDGVISLAESLTPYATTMTDAQGNYIFTGLDAGNYQVGFDQSTFPAGYDLTAGNNDQGSDDALDSDADPITGLSPMIPLAQGEDNLTVDAGIYNPTATNSIGDFVWLDADGDGVQDPGEVPIPNVTVNLLDANGNIIASVQTDENGNYLFDNLPDGTYSVQVVSPPGYDVTDPNGIANGGTAANNSDIDANGQTQEVVLSGNTHITDLDAGLTTTQASLGDRVWVDTNGDGIQDPGEPGVPGVTVSLYRPGVGPDGIPGNGDDADPVSTTVTDANGNYWFPNLDPGTYDVTFSDIPSGYGFTTQNAGADDGDDSDADPATGTASGITLNPGDINSTVDAGLVPIIPGSVGDNVWFDADGDGIQDPGENGIPGVQVILKDSLGNVVGTTFTDGDGNYIFTDLPPGGGYTITFIPPAGSTLTLQGAGNGDDDSDADPISGVTAPFSITPGGHTPNVDAGITSYMPLPVVFSSFELQTKACNVELSWTVSEEENVQFYNVMRKRQGAERFERIAQLKSLGLSGAGSDYTYTDVNVTSGKHIYQIESEDLDGSTSSSQNKLAQVDCDQVDINVFPNPTTDRVQVQITSNASKKFEIRVIDLNGRILLNEETILQDDYATLFVNLENLANGMYNVQVIGNLGETATFKVQKID